MLKKLLKFILEKIIKDYLNYFLKKNKYLIIFRCGNAIGEHVYMSSVIKKLFNQNKKIILFTNYYFLYENNPHVYKIFKFKKKSYIWFFLKNLVGDTILEFNSIYATKINHINNNKYFLYFHKNRKIHLAEAMSQHFNLIDDYSNLKNYFFFSEKEYINYEKEFDLKEKFSLIQSTTKKKFTENKEWKVDGMQKIVNHFNNIKWIQIGTSEDPNLEGCEHMLDLDLRKTAYLIKKCNFLISYEGLFNHLASCFDTKNFLIHTGFLPEQAFYYKNNILIEKNSEMSCYPCYSIKCTDHKKEFLSKLNDEFVIKTIEKNI